MLPKKYRLPPEQLREVLRTGKPIYSSGLQIKIIKTSNPFSRFAIMIPYSFDKRSSHRHRQKRLLTESVWKIISSIKPGFDSIIRKQDKQPDESLTQSLMRVNHVLKASGLLV